MASSDMESDAHLLAGLSTGYSLPEATGFVPPQAAPAGCASAEPPPDLWPAGTIPSSLPPPGKSSRSAAAPPGPFTSCVGTLVKEHTGTSSDEVQLGQEHFSNIAEIELL